jgi:hypothetical protein
MFCGVHPVHRFGFGGSPVRIAASAGGTDRDLSDAGYALRQKHEQDNDDAHCLLVAQA